MDCSNVSTLWYFVCTHRCRYKTTSFEIKQSIAYIYIFKTLPTLHFNFLKIIINALSFMWVAIIGTCCVERKERMSCISILIWKYTICTLIIYQKHRNVNQVYITALKRFRIFSNSLDSERVGTIHYRWVNWCSCAMSPWKNVVLIFLHQKWFGLAVMGKYHSKLLMMFNLAFWMKCRYIKIHYTVLVFINMAFYYMYITR